METKRKKLKKIRKTDRAKKLSKILEGVLCVKHGLYTISLTEEDILQLLIDHKIDIEDGDLICKINTTDK